MESKKTDELSESDVLNKNKQKFVELFNQALKDKKFTAEELSHSTRISLEFIKALQKGDFTKLPGLVFVRGFIRNICKAMKLDSKEMLACFDSGFLYESTLESSTQPQPSEDLHRSKFHWITLSESWLTQVKNLSKILRGFSLRFWLISLATLTLGVIIFYPYPASVEDKQTFVQKVEEPKEEKNQILPQSSQAEEKKTEDVTANFDTQSNPEAKQEGVKVESATALPTTSSTNITQSSGQVLYVKVLASTKIKLKLDQEKEKTLALEPGDYEFKFSDQSDIFLDDAGAVELSFNGQSLGSLGNEGRKRRLSFKATSVLEKKLDNKASKG